MNSVLVTCGLSNSKLHGKLAGLSLSQQVDQIILVRKKPLHGEKITNVNPPAWIGRFTLLFEIWRFLCLLCYGYRYRVQLFVGIQAQMHGAAAVIAAALLGAKSALWLIGSDLLIYSEQGPLAPIIRYSIRRSETVFVMGEFSRQVVNELCGRSRRVFVQQVACYQETMSTVGLMDKKWEMLFVGNLVEVKAPLAAVKIFSKVHQAMPSARFCIIGDGNLMDEVVKEVERRELTPYIDILGRVHDPLSYVGASRLLVIPSKSEGLPSVLIEAATLGVPVVASSVGEITSLAIECPGIKTSPSGDINSFVESSLTLLLDENAYCKSSNAILNFGIRYAEQWSAEKQKAVWEKAFFLDH